MFGGHVQSLGPGEKSSFMFFVFLVIGFAVLFVEILSVGYVGGFLNPSPNPILNPKP